MQKKVCVIGLAVLAIPALSNAAPIVLVSDNFEYADQAAYQAVWPAIATVAPTSAELSTEQAMGGVKSIKLPGTGTTGQSRNRLTIAETGAIPTGLAFEWSYDFYDSAPTAGPARNYCNLQDGTGPTLANQLVAMGMNNNQTGANSGGQYYMARILGYTVPTTADPDGGATESVGGSGAFFKLNDFGVGLRTLGWHNLKVVMSSDDGIATDYEFYVDGQLAERVSNIGTVLRSYDNIALGSGVSNASTAAYVDNMYLAVVPEPTVLSGAALGALALLRRRRD